MKTLLRLDRKSFEYRTSFRVFVAKFEAGYGLSADTAPAFASYMSPQRIHPMKVPEHQHPKLIAPEIVLSLIVEFSLKTLLRNAQLGALNSAVFYYLLERERAAQTLLNNIKVLFFSKKGALVLGLIARLHAQQNHCHLV
jgi:hypothetical protein